MKKIIVKVLFLMSIVLLVLAACSNIQQYNIKYICSQGGTIVGICEQTVEEGSDGSEVEAVACEGYVFVQWSDGNTNPKRLEANVKADVTLTAEFNKVEYSIVYVAASGGKIQGCSNQAVAHGESTESVVAVALDDWQFIEWSDGVTSPRRTDIANCDKTITAIFSPIVQYKATVGGTITGGSFQTVNVSGEAETVTAVAQVGYKFVKWSDGVAEPKRKDIDIQEPIDVTAEFEFLFGGGLGTIDEPFLIENLDHLNNMRYYPTNNYLLSCDLDAFSTKFEPIFLDDACFLGVFDGGKHTISNLLIDVDCNYASLFGQIGLGASIRNLNITNANIILSDFNTEIYKQHYCVGILAGVSYGSLSNINVQGLIAAEALSHDGIAVGGIVGRAFREISNVQSNVQIQLKDVGPDSTNMNYAVCVGGIVGVADAVRITNCNVNGNFEVQGSSNSVNVGGLVGVYYNSNTVDTARIANCIVDLQISSQSYQEVGGLISVINTNSGTSTSISDCVLNGKINVPAARASAFIYEIYNNGNFEINDSHAENDVIAYNNASGFIGFASDATIRNCYSTSNVTAMRISASGGSGGIAAGFIRMASKVEMYMCYHVGKINSLTRSIINNSYSASDVYVTNANPDNTGRTLIGGFIFGLDDSSVNNCYYSGQVYGSVYSSGQFGFGHIVGAFVGTIKNSSIENSYLLHANKDFAPEIIMINNNTANEEVSIITFENIEQMYKLADVLNTDDAIVWRNNASNTPKLIFADNSKIIN